MARAAVLIVTHGPAGLDMLGEVTRLVGSDAVSAMEALPVPPTEPRELTTDRIHQAVARLDRGAGVLVVVDLAGSTPCNCAVQLKRTGDHVEVLCGVSLPMLMKLASLDRERLGLGELAHEAAATAMRSIRMGDGGTP